MISLRAYLSGREEGGFRPVINPRLLFSVGITVSVATLGLSTISANTLSSPESFSSSDMRSKAHPDIEDVRRGGG